MNLNIVTFGYFHKTIFLIIFKSMHLIQKNPSIIKESKLFFIKFEVAPRKPNQILPFLYPSIF
jgi:hypothetical protein